MDKDFFKIISDSLNTAQSSTELFISAKKNNFLLAIKKELVSLVFYFISLLLILVSIGYLLLFALGRLLAYLRVEPIYFGPVCACILLLFGLTYLISSGYLKARARLAVVNKAEKSLKTPKQDLSDLKSSLLWLVNKYKIIFIAGIFTYLFYLVSHTPKVSRNHRRKLKKQILGIDNKAIMDDMKGLVVTVLLLLIKEFIEHISSSSVKPSNT